MKKKTRAAGERTGAEVQSMDSSLVFSCSKLGNIIPVRDLIDLVVRSVTNQRYYSKLLTSAPHVHVYTKATGKSNERNRFGGVEKEKRFQIIRQLYCTRSKQKRNRRIRQEVRKAPRHQYHPASVLLFMRSPLSYPYI